MDAPHVDRRRQELSVDDEEGLIQLQAQFLAGQSGAQPAARVTRVSRKTPVPQQSLQQPSATLTSSTDAHAPVVQTAAPQQQQQPPGPAQAQKALDASVDQAASTAAAAAEQDEQLCPSIPGILTCVKERETGPETAPGGSVAAAESAFPKAVHRKQSKFALARRKPHTTDSQPAGTAAHTSTAHDGSGPSTALPGLTAQPAAATSPPAAAAAAKSAGVRHPVSAESAGVDAANLQRIAEMSLEEVTEAQEEITARFDPAVLEHLRKRHAAKQQGQGQQQQQQQQGHVQQLAAADANTQPQEAARGNAAKAAAATARAVGQGTGFKKGFLGGSGTRGAAAAAAAGAGAAGAGGAGNGVGAANAKESTPPTSSAGIRKGFLQRSALTKQPQQQQQQQQQQQNRTAVAADPTKGTNRSPAAAAVQNAGPPSGPLPPVARLRFSIHGQVLELAHPKTPPSNPKDVLMRDNLSRAAGTVPEGYTLLDIGVLVRSRHGPQRAVGFRMLAATLRRAQGLVYHVGNAGQLQPQMVVLDVLSDNQLQQQQQQGEQQQGEQQQLQQGQQQQDDQQQQQQQRSRETGVSWSDVWQYAVVVLRTVMLCRLGLDEDNVQVLTAAADALRVLLGRSSSELLLEESAAANSSLGWPLTWRAQLRRLDAAGAWDTVENLVKAAQQESSLAPQAEGDASMLPDTPEDLAAVDPLAGFLASEPLTRIRFLLQQHQGNAELTVSLLAILEATAAASKAAAESVVRTKGMPACLMGLLGLGPLGSSGSNGGGCSSNGGSSGSNGSAAGVIAAACRVPVLRLLRLLSSASSMNTQLLRTAGMETAVQLLLCTSGSDTNDSTAAAAAVGAGGQVSSSSNSSSSSDAGEAGDSKRSGAAAAAAANRDAAIGLLLQKLEALRIWHVAATHGVTLCHVDVMFPYMAAMLQPPTPIGSKASSSSSSSSSDQERALQWLLCCEAFQLLQVLLNHALRVSGGDKALGREMITPGCAAAVAAAAARDWLQPGVWREVGQALVCLSDCQLPYTLDPNRPPGVGPTSIGTSGNFPTSHPSNSSSSSSPYRDEESAAEAAALQRVVSSLHSALLLPPAASQLSAVAAVLQYLDAYWGTLQQVPWQLAGELQQQLEGVGLWGCGGPTAAAAAAGGGCPATSSAGGVGATHEAAHIRGRLEGSRQALAACLLSLPGASPQQQQQQQQIGAAVLQYGLALLKAAGAMHGRIHGALHGVVRGSVHGMNDPLAVHAMASGAAGFLLGLCQLQQQLQMHCGTMQQQQQQVAETALDAADLPSKVLSVVCSNTRIWLQHTGVAVVLEPWRLAHYTLQQYQLRLLLKLAGTVLRPGPLQQQQQQQRQQQQWQVTDALLAVLPLSAPGQEGQALHALQLLFDTQPAQQQQQQQQQQGESTVSLGSPVSPAAGAVVPTGVLLEAAAAIKQLQQQGGSLAAAAAGHSGDAAFDGNAAAAAAAAAAGPGPGLWADVPYPPPVLSRALDVSTAAAAAAAGDGSALGSTAVDAAIWSRVLLQGYAVTWLSVIADMTHVPQQQQQQQQQQGRDASKLPAKALAQLPQVFVTDVEGSRLPVPPEWLLLEIHAVPSPGSSGSSGSSGSNGGGCGSMHPVAAALLLALGLQQAPGSSYMACIPPGRRLEALLRLMYNFDVWELLPAAATVPQQQQQQQQQEFVPAWQDAAARWAAAVLSEGFCWEVVCGAAGVPGVEPSCTLKQQQQQQQLYPCQVKDLVKGAQGASKLNQQQQQQQGAPLFPSWSRAPAAAQIIDRLVTDLSEVSFGDPLFGAHVALLLLPAAGSRMQRCCWGALMDHRAMHLLPPPCRCIGGALAYLGVDIDPNGGCGSNCGSDGGCGSKDSSGSSGGGWGFAGFDAQLVGDMAKALAQGDLRKSMQMQGLTWFLALHGVAALCLNQRAWSDRGVTSPASPAAAAGVTAGGVGSGRAGSEQRQGDDADAMNAVGGSMAQKPASQAAMAVNVLRGVVRACAPELLQLLLKAGRARGLDEQDMIRALVQCAHGDGALMEKVRRLM